MTKEPKGIGSSIRVLVVHDDDTLGELFRLILSKQGAIVHTAPMRLGVATAQQVLPHLIIINSEFLSDEDYYHYKTTPALQDVLILFIDAKPHEMVDRQARQLGGNGYLIEPFTAPDIIAAYQTVMRGERYYPSLPDRP
jgi:DNA-binding response OmpR family regulator